MTIIHIILYMIYLYISYGYILLHIRMSICCENGHNKYMFRVFHKRNFFPGKTIYEQRRSNLSNLREL